MVLIAVVVRSTDKQAQWLSMKTLGISSRRIPHISEMPPQLWIFIDFQASLNEGVGPLA